MIVLLLLLLLVQQRSANLLLPLHPARGRARTCTQWYYLNLVPFQPDHSHLIESVGREWLLAVNAPSEAGLIGMELGLRVYEVVCTEECGVFWKNGVEITGYKTTTSGAKVGGNDRELARAEGRLDWEGVQVHVDEANAGEIFMWWRLRGDNRRHGGCGGC